MASRRSTSCSSAARARNDCTGLLIVPTLRLDGVLPWGGSRGLVALRLLGGCANEVNSAR
jgi:hypothetical protein